MNIKLTTTLALAAFLALPAASQAQNRGSASGHHGGGYFGPGGHGPADSQVTPRHYDRAEQRVRELSRDTRALSSTAYGYEDGSIDRAIADAQFAVDRADHALRRGQIGVAYGEIEAAEFSLADAQQRMARLDRQLRSERATAVQYVEAAIQSAHRGTPPSVRALIRDAQFECERGDNAERSGLFAEARRAYASSASLAERAIRLNPREYYVESRPVHVPAPRVTYVPPPRVTHVPAARPAAYPVRHERRGSGRGHGRSY